MCLGWSLKAMPAVYVGYVDVDIDVALMRGRRRAEDLGEFGGLVSSR